MPDKRLLLIIVTVSMILLLGYFYLSSKTGNITDFESCAKNNPVMESYPRKCSADGKTYTEEIKSPKPTSDLKTSPILIIPQKEEGICKNMCGNNVCQEIVCLGSNCPCPETIDNCPKDCKIE